MAPHASSPSRPVTMDGDAQSQIIIDIRKEKMSFSLEEDIKAGLCRETGNKTLPTLLLYSEEGLKIFEEITYNPEYYLTNTEIGVLETYCSNIAERIADNTVVVELGSGNLRKVGILLRALENQGKRIDYYALDLDREELNRTLSLIDTSSFEHVKFHGLHGTYNDGRVWLKENDKVKDRPRCVLWLGSSAGNFDRVSAAKFLKEFAEEALRPHQADYMLVGLDGCKEGEKVRLAYNDTNGCTERFIKTGLLNANSILGGEYFIPEDWSYVGEWNAEEGRHQAYLVPKRDMDFSGKLKGVFLHRGERINIEYSYKFDHQDARTLWDAAGLSEGASWTNDAGDYALRMVRKPTFDFGTSPADYAGSPIPTLNEWKELWAAWDAVTLGMIPKNELLSKPIDLRNPCIFYLGHIPCFLDSLLVKCGEAPTEPAAYFDIFLRGIDPDVENPELCHKHSAIPDEWPSIEEIQKYTEDVRTRVQALYKKGTASHLSTSLRRAIWTGFEHEVMHIETLLYMLLQSDKTLPPPGAIRPDFAAGRAWELSRDSPDSGCWHRIPAMTISVGLTDLENPEDATPNFMGWDNEKPRREGVKVDSFLVRSYPVTISEYAKFLHANSKTVIPASWVSTIDDSRNISDRFEVFLKGIFIKTIFGPVPLEQAMDWPVMASYNELEECIKWLNGRIPTANELRAVYQVAAEVETANTRPEIINGVNGHLVHNGVRETPPPHNSQCAGVNELFTNLSHANVGFKRWHPTSVRAYGNKLLGRGETGGAWEYTSSVLEMHKGFEPSKLYPEYTGTYRPSVFCNQTVALAATVWFETDVSDTCQVSGSEINIFCDKADFFDSKHNIVLGGSWVTHPRIAGRTSFVNWYQRSYRYTWATARIVKLE